MNEKQTTIRVENLTKQYGTFTAVKDISFQVHRGEVLGFLGPNGAGKSTTMKILTSYLAPTDGRVEIAGMDVSLDSLAARKHIGYLPEGTPLYKDMTVLEYLEFVARLRCLKAGGERQGRIQKVVEQCGLGDRLGFLIGELSKGFKQRVGLAQAILHEPDVLILDEPTSGLDPNQIVGIREVIREVGRERTVIFSTHIMQEVQAVCSRVLIIAKGRIVADGTLPELRKKVSGPMRLRVGFQQAEPSMLESLSRVRGVSEVLPVRTSDGRATYEGQFVVIAKETMDPRAEIFTMAKDRGLPLIELTQEFPSLEEVFRALTGASSALPEREHHAKRLNQEEQGL